MMEFIFKYIKRTRELFVALVNSLSIEQLNKIPEGYRNNIAWNFGHILVTTQLLCYVRTQVDVNRQIEFALHYSKGTKPERFIKQAEINELKKQLTSTIDMIEKDLKNGMFKNIIPFATTTYQHEMHNIDEILTCALAHDSLHYGYALAQRKLVI